MSFEDKFKSDKEPALPKKCIRNRELEKNEKGLGERRSKQESGKTVRDRSPNCI